VEARLSTGRTLINTLLQLGVPPPPQNLNRFSGFPYSHSVHLARFKVSLDHGAASFVSFSPPKRGEGRDEGARLTFKGVISPLSK